MKRFNHPIADLFPMMGKQELGKLTSSILIEGLREPIVLFEKKILDGRARYEACIVAGVLPGFEEFKGADPYEFTVKKKLAVKKYTAGQRALIAARMMLLVYHNASKGLVHGYVSAGKIFGVNRSSVQGAVRILEDGTPEEIKFIEEGGGAKYIYDAIRRRKPEKEWKHLFKGTQHRTPAQIAKAARLKTHMNLWAELKGALESLTHMPRPDDMIEVVRQMKRGNTSATLGRLPSIIEWLIEFNHEIEKTNLVQKDEKTNVTENNSTTGDSDPNARHGDEAAGSQHAEPPSE